MSTLSNQDIRAKILEDLYKRKRQGLEILTRPEEYARLLNIPVELAIFNIQYLISAGLVQGDSWGGMGTTKKWSFIDDLTAFGYEAMEGRRGQDLSVNFSIINVNAPVTQSQIAAGSKIEQTQSLHINTLQDLQQYLDQRFSGAEIESLKSQLRDLEEQIKADVVKPSTLRKIKEIVTSLGPAALVVMEVLQKILGLGNGH